MSKKIALVGIYKGLEDRIRKIVEVDDCEFQKLCGIGHITPYEQLTRDCSSKNSNLVIIDGRLSANRKFEPIDDDIREIYTDCGVQRSIQLAKNLRKNEMYSKVPILIRAYDFENPINNICGDELNLGLISDYSHSSESLLSEIILSN